MASFVIVRPNLFKGRPDRVLINPKTRKPLQYMTRVQAEQGAKKRLGVDGWRVESLESVTDILS